MWSSFLTLRIEWNDPIKCCFIALIHSFGMSWIYGDIWQHKWRYIQQKIWVVIQRYDLKGLLLFYLTTELLYCLCHFQNHWIKLRFLKLVKYSDEYIFINRDLIQQNFARFGYPMRGQTTKLTQPFIHHLNSKLCCYFWTTL